MPRSFAVRTLLTLSLLGLLGCSTGSVDGAGPPPLPAREDCANFVDDDGDNAADCADIDCAYEQACRAGGGGGAGDDTQGDDGWGSYGELDCADGYDDDHDNAIDCADIDCAGEPACDTGGQAREVLCDNTIDDDADGAADCNDADCLASPDCGGGDVEPDDEDPFADDPEDWEDEPADPGGADSCQWARDGMCDEPDLCDPGTDTTDCLAEGDQPEDDDPPVGSGDDCGGGDSCHCDDMCDECGDCCADCGGGGGGGGGGGVCDCDYGFDCEDDCACDPDC